MVAAAIVHRTAFDERLPWLAGLHTPNEDRGYFENQLFAACEIWGAEEAGGLVGIVAFRDGWIDQLYVLPGRQRAGVGSALLKLVMTRQPLLELWTFQRNAGARAFYEARGFQPVRFTDGRDNEEKEPDVLYRWEATACVRTVAS
jgi:GNAT superfamily N-acetyltransferase